MPITLPSWLQAPDVAGDYQRGLQIGVSVAEARSRLAAQEQENAMRAQVESQQQQQQHALEQQRIATTAAYQQNVIQLRKQQLDQVKAMNDLKTANAARQFAAKQQWQSGFDKIDADTTLNDEQKDAAKTRLTMSLAPMMGMAGTEAASMLRDMRPPKPTVPAQIEDKDDFLQITQPNGTISLHNKAKAGSEGNVTIQLPDPSQPNSEATVYRTVPKSEAGDIIASLPPNLQTNAVNRAATRGSSPSPSPKSKYATVADVKSDYRAGHLTREQASKILTDQFGIKAAAANAQ